MYFNRLSMKKNKTNKQTKKQNKTKKNPQINKLVNRHYTKIISVNFQ